MLYKHCLLYFSLVLFILLSAACSTLPPDNPRNACDIIQDKSSWKKPLKRTQKTWQTKPSIVLSFMYHESGFRSKAKPARRKLLGFIPWFRPSDAYGYAQATKATWQAYKMDANRFFVRRDNFSDSADFIGWYNSVSTKKYGISPQDPYRLYLAYHEGHTGYGKGYYKKKGWLLETANRVKEKAFIYDRQLKSCGF